MVREDHVIRGQVGDERRGRGVEGLVQGEANTAVDRAAPVVDARIVEERRDGGRCGITRRVVDDMQLPARFGLRLEAADGPGDEGGLAVRRHQDRRSAGRPCHVLQDAALPRRRDASFRARRAPRTPRSRTDPRPAGRAAGHPPAAPARRRDMSGRSRGASSSDDVGPRVSAPVGSARHRVRCLSLTAISQIATRVPRRLLPVDRRSCPTRERAGSFGRYPTADQAVARSRSRTRTRRARARS